jgi:threonine dehydrogenase-like Zn-dependent dehydrogenase
MAQQSAFLMGAERVIAIDRFPERLRMAREQVGAELNPSYLATHRFSLEEAPRGYEMFKNKEDGCVRAVFVP